MQQIELFRGSENLDVSALGSTECLDRILGIQRTRWVPYQVGEKTLGRLAHMADSPASHRPPCLLIYGDTNMGKSVIALKFTKDRNRDIPDTVDHLVRPVVFIQNPPVADFGALLSFVLLQLNAPIPATARIERRLTQVLELMKAAKVRMLIIDEIHHILVGKADERIRILNGLKFLSTELQIPIVLIGTIEAMRTIQTNQQLGNRFESFHIPRWENGEEYARFLSGCGAATTIGKGAWQSKKFVTRFHSMAEGMTGETWKLMCKAAEVALRSERLVIDDATLDQVDWRRPRDRRRG